MKKLTRSEFFKLFIPFFVILGLGKWAAACGGNNGDTDDGGDGGGGNGPQPDCLNAGTNVAIANNHNPPHVLVVSKADVAAGTEKTYDITGGAAHEHSVTLTAAHFTNLAANQQIVVASSPADGAGHTHNVTVSCALA